MEAFLFDPEGFVMRMLALFGATVFLHCAVLFVLRAVLRDRFLAGVATVGVEFALSAVLMCKSSVLGGVGLAGFAAGSLTAELERSLRAIMRL